MKNLLIMLRDNHRLVVMCSCVSSDDRYKMLIVCDWLPRAIDIGVTRTIRAPDYALGVADLFSTSVPVHIDGSAQIELSVKRYKYLSEDTAVVKWRGLSCRV